MKYTVIPQVRAISGSTPQEAALLFNEAIMELAPLHPSFQREGDTYYIQYNVQIAEAETLADKYEMAGKKAKCKDCPHCIRDRNRFGDIDARKVWATCSATGERVRIRGEACDIYYEEMERGSDAEEH